MRFYEIRIITPPGTTARELEQRAKGVAERIDRPMKIIGATIHARPTEGYHNRHDGALFVIDEGDETNQNFYMFAGRMAYMHGMPMVDPRKFGEKSLSLKDDPDAVDQFIKDTVGGSRLLYDDDPQNDDFAIDEDIVDKYDGQGGDERQFDADIGPDEADDE